MLPIIEAFTEGKQIEIKPKVKDADWSTLEIDTIPYIDFNKCDLRIKPEPKYRPFKDSEECWNEIQKHKPFRWIKKISGHCRFLYIMELYSTGIIFNNVDNFGSFKNLLKTYNFAFTETTFADGTPFGIK